MAARLAIAWYWEAVVQQVRRMEPFADLVPAPRHETPTAVAAHDIMHQQPSVV